MVESDTFSMEVPMNKEDMQPIVFGVCQRKHEKAMRKQFGEMDTLTRNAHHPQLPATLS